MLGAGGGSLVGKVALLVSIEGAVFISLKEDNNELDLALGTGGFITGIGTGTSAVLGDGGILIGARGGGEQAAVGSKYSSSFSSCSSLGSRYTSSSVLGTGAGAGVGRTGGGGITFFLPGFSVLSISGGFLILGSKLNCSARCGGFKGLLGLGGGATCLCGTAGLDVSR